MNTSKDYYAVLGVLPSIEEAALAAVYRALVKKYHPDVFDGPPAEGARITVELNEAYEVLGNAAKRAAYDKARKSESPAGDYERQSGREQAETKQENEKSNDWQYVIRYRSDVESLRIKLERLSPALAFTFQVMVIEGKLSDDSQSLFQTLRSGFLRRYFGTSTQIHEFVVDALLADRRDVALEVNRAIRILGSPSDAQTGSFIEKVEITTSWRRWPHSAEQTTTYGEEPLRSPPSTFEVVTRPMIFVLVAILIGLIILGVTSNR